MSAKSNKTVLSVATESSTIGTLPGSPVWTELEWNSLDTWGATISTIARNPVSTDRMQKKGAVSDLDSAVGFQTDLTCSAFETFRQGFFYANNQSQQRVNPTAIAASTDTFTHSAITAIPANSLIFARNFSNSANNGLHVVTSSTTITTVVTSALVDESSPPTGSRFDVAGYKGTTGDIELDASGNLISTTLDFTTLGIQVGQSIYIGGSAALNQFATATYKGLARVRAVAANLITLDKRDWTVGAADDGSAKEIHIYIGSFISNVPQDDSDFLEETYTFEGKFEGLEAGNTIVYEYPNGCKPNDMVLDFPLGENAGVSYSFIGLDTPVPTATQDATGSRVSTYDTDAFGTTSDCARLSLKDSSLTDYTTRFKNLSLTIANGVNPEKTICSLGASDMNIGDFIVSGSAQVLLSDEDMISAVRNNETTTLDYAMKNDDGVIHLDIPEMTFGTATKSFPESASVLLDLDLKTQKSDFFNFVMSCTMYPYTP